jgi:hypothetical protein
MEQALKWLKQSTWHAVSECGRYEMRGKFDPNGNFWNAFLVSTGQLICASSDKAFVKGRCEAHASGKSLDIHQPKIASVDAS